MEFNTHKKKPQLKLGSVFAYEQEMRDDNRKYCKDGKSEVENRKLTIKSNPDNSGKDEMAVYCL